MSHDVTRGTVDERDNSLLTVARLTLDFGWSVIPVAANKKPLLAWLEYQRRPPSLNEVTQWLSTGKVTALAVVTGSVSRLVVLDFDGDAGNRTMERLGLKPHVRTPSGGFHVYLQHPGWRVLTRNHRSSCELGGRHPGMDIRADGGYAIFAGRSGLGEYKWVRKLVPDPLAILPKDVREFLGLLQAPPETTAVCATPESASMVAPRVFAGLLVRKALGGVPAEGRNNRGYWLACQLRDNGYSRSEAEATLLRYVQLVPGVNRHGQPEAYTRQEALASLEQVYRRPPREPWKTVAPPLQKVGAAHPSAVPLASESQDVAARTRATYATCGETSMVGPRESQAQQILDLIEKLESGGQLELFHNELREPFARVLIGDHFENIAIRDRTFHEWLMRLVYKAKGIVFNQQAVVGVRDLLAARAKFDGPEHRLYNRVAWQDGSIWYDLSDRDWRAVRITPAGWAVEVTPPILFRRYAHQRPQVEPRRGGSIDTVLPFFNLAGLDEKRFLITTILSFFVPEIPHPIAAFHGEHGSAKTTLCKFIRAWVDPSETLTLGEPAREQILQTLAHNYVLPLDNLGRIEPWLSDVLCRAVTGEGYTKRKLFTDQDDVVLAFRRCVVLNGINSLPQLPDLLDRSILFRLLEIPEGRHREELEIISQFEDALPLILGAGFTLLSEAMKLHDTFRLKMAPRMADFARWGALISHIAGWSAEQFITNYQKEASVRNEAAIEASPVAQTVRVFAEEQKSKWEGTAGELLAMLAKVAAQLGIDTRAKEWPKQPNVLSRRLNEVVPNLRKTGVRISHGWKAKNKQIIVSIVGIEGSPLKRSAYAPTTADDTDGTGELSSTTKVSEPL